MTYYFFGGFFFTEFFFLTAACCLAVGSLREGTAPPSQRFFSPILDSSSSSFPTSSSSSSSHFNHSSLHSTVQLQRRRSPPPAALFFFLTGIVLCVCVCVFYSGVFVPFFLVKFLMRNHRIPPRPVGTESTDLGIVLIAIYFRMIFFSLHPTIVLFFPFWKRTKQCDRKSAMTLPRHSDDGSIPRSSNNESK